MSSGVLIDECHFLNLVKELSCTRLVLKVQLILLLCLVYRGRLTVTSKQDCKTLKAHAVRNAEVKRLSVASHFRSNSGIVNSVHLARHQSMVVRVRVSKQLCKLSVTSQSSKNTVLNLRVVSIHHYIAVTRNTNACNSLRILLCIRVRAAHTTSSSRNLSEATENISTWIHKVRQIIVELNKKSIFLLILSIHISYRVCLSSVIVLSL